MTSFEKKREILFSLSALALSVSILAVCFTYPPEASSFPKFIAALMVFFSLALVGKSFCAQILESNPSEAKSFFKALGGAIAVIACTALYALGIIYVGYFVSTTIFFFITMVLYGKNKIMPFLFASAGFMGIMYGLFVWFLGMRLPEAFLF